MIFAQTSAEKSILDARKLKIAREAQTRDGSLQLVARELGFDSEEQALAAVGATLGMDIVDPDTDETHWHQLSWEQIDTYRADVILGDSRGGRVDQILELIPPAARDIADLDVDQLARWEAVFAPGWANMARIMDDLTEVVETADPDRVP